VNVFESVESEVRGYCRGGPVVFDRAVGSWLYDEDGNEYLDFFAGAGALNYGHNNSALKRHGMLLIVDDMQMGRGRTGPFYPLIREA
jgi:4-aminobutyrate aminotransferase-like enzyme